MSEPTRPRLPITEAEAAQRLNITAQALAHRRRRGVGLPYTTGLCRAGQIGMLYDPLDVEIERQRDVELRRRHPVIDAWRSAW